MSRTERIALWAVVGGIALGLAVLAIITLGEIAALRRSLGAPSPALPAPPTSEPPRAAPQPARVGIGGVAVLSDTLVLTVTVRMSGAGDLLYEPPVVTDGSQEYAITGESLERARFAFLDLVTKGAATARLEFSPAPDPGRRLTLIFNPGRRPEDPITPRVEVPVPMPAK